MKREEMSAWLHDWDRAVVANGRIAGAELISDPGVRESVLRQGATRQSLAAAEVRLGMKLPPELRSLLTLTDGAYADAGGVVDHHDRRSHTSEPGLGLLRADDIVPVMSVEAERIKILVEISPGVESVDVEGGATIGLSPLADPRALLIGSSTPECMGTALVPVGRSWRLMHVTRDEVLMWSSIGVWLESASYRPGAESIMQLVTWARDYDPRGQNLEKVRDPEAKPYLIAALEEFDQVVNVTGRLLWALTYIGGDDAVDAILTWSRGAPGRKVAGYLRLIGSPKARDALVELDAWTDLAQLGDVRGIRRGLELFKEGKERVFASYAGLTRHPVFGPTLRTELDHFYDPESEHSRFNFGVALLRCGDPVAIEEMRTMANDPDFRWHIQCQSILADYEEEFPPAE